MSAERVTDSPSQHQDQEAPPAAATTAATAAGSSFFVVNLPDLNRLSYCCDIGWVGINDESVAEVFQGPISIDEDDVTTPELTVNPTYIIASVPSKRGVFAYGVVMGSIKNLKSKTAVKDRFKRDMPKYWTRVVRVAWLRVASAPWDSFSETMITGGDSRKTLFSWMNDVGATFLSSATTISSVPGSEGTAPCAWFKLPPRCGEEVVAAIEAKGLTVLPHDLRAAHLNPEAYISSRQDGQQNGNGAPPQHSSPGASRSEQAIPMSFGGGPRGYQGSYGGGGVQQYQGHYSNQQQQGYNGGMQQQGGGGGFGGGGPASSHYGAYYGQQQQQQQYQQQQQQQPPYEQHRQQGDTGSAAANPSALTAGQIEELAVAALYAQSSEEQRNAMSEEDKASTMAYYRNYYATYVPQ